MGLTIYVLAIPLGCGKKSDVLPTRANMALPQSHSPSRSTFAVLGPPGSAMRLMASIAHNDVEGRASGHRVKEQRTLDLDARRLLQLDTTGRKVWESTMQTPVSS